MIRKLNPGLSDRGRLLVFSDGLLLVHIMWVVRTPGFLQTPVATEVTYSNTEPR